MTYRDDPLREDEPSLYEKLRRIVAVLPPPSEPLKMTQETWDLLEPHIAKAPPREPWEPDYTLLFGVPIHIVDDPDEVNFPRRNP